MVKGDYISFTNCLTDFDYRVFHLSKFLKFNAEKIASVRGVSVSRVKISLYKIESIRKKRKEQKIDDCLDCFAGLMEGIKYDVFE